MHPRKPGKRPIGPRGPKRPRKRVVAPTPVVAPKLLKRGRVGKSSSYRRIKEQLKSATADQIRGVVSEAARSANPAKALLAKGLTRKGLEVHRITLSELKGLNFSPKNLRLFGFSPIELRKAGFLDADVAQAGYDISTMKKHYGPRILKDMGYPLKQIATAFHLTAPRLHEVFPHISLEELRDAGFTDSSVTKASRNAVEMREARMAIRDAAKRFHPAELLKAGYTIQELASIGITARYWAQRNPNLEAILNMGYTVADLEKAGITAQFWLNRKHTPGDLLKLGYTQQQITAAFRAR